MVLSKWERTKRALPADLAALNAAVTSTAEPRHSESELIVYSVRTSVSRNGHWLLIPPVSSNVADGSLMVETAKLILSAFTHR
jgi:hypothetical protein